MARSELNDARRRLQLSIGESNYHLELFGDALAVREGYKVHDGLEAVRYYLMCKHGWLPRDAMQMGHEELRFAIAEEMVGFKLPADA